MRSGGEHKILRAQTIMGGPGVATAARVVAKPVLALTTLHKIVLALAGVGILTASSYVSVPFFPVPLTLQTLAVLLLGGLLGPMLAASSVAGYLAIGAMGAPVFHNGLGGLVVLGGPTAGYLIGFLPAVIVMGLAVRAARKANADQSAALTGWRPLGILAMGAFVATVVIYAVGTLWLALFTGQDLILATKIGVVPFLLGDALKAAVAVGTIAVGGGFLTRKGFLLR